MKSKNFFGILCVFLVVGGFLFGEENKLNSEEEIYRLYAVDQLVEGLVLSLEKREQNLFNKIFLQAIKKYKCKAYKKAFVEKLGKYFNDEEMKQLIKFYSVRQEALKEIEKLPIKDKFYDFNTDLNLLLAELKDDGKESSPKERVEDMQVQIKQARYKSCSANMRILSAVIEMYNMDHPQKMTTLKPEDYQKSGILRTSSLLNKALRLPEKDCEYYVIKDSTASEPIDVQCKIHGERMKIENSDE